MLIDTSGLLSMCDESEQFHVLAGQQYTASRVRVTHSYVLAEWVPLAQKRNISRQVAMRLSVGLMDDPEVKLVWVDKELHRAGVELLIARSDKNYSLCDAVSFVLMRRLALTDALTTDKHFEQEGFVRLLK